MINEGEWKNDKFHTGIEWMFGGPLLCAESLLPEGTKDSPRGIPLNPALVIEIDLSDDNAIIEGERIDLKWIENLVIGAKKCLDLDTVAKAGEFCEYCAYVDSVSKF